MFGLLFLKYPLYEAIYSVAQKQKLGLEFIPKPCPSSREIVSYSNATWELRETLQSLFISNISLNITGLPYINFNNADESATKLNMFSQLKNIEFIVTQNTNSLCKVFSSLQHCKSLNYVDIYQYYRGSSDENDYTRLKKHKSNIKTLKVVGLVCGDNLLEYLIYTFDHLDRFNIRFLDDCDRPLNEQNTVSRSTYAKLLHYLYKTKPLHIGNISADNLLDIISEFFSSLVSVALN